MFAEVWVAQLDIFPKVGDDVRYRLPTWQNLRVEQGDYEQTGKRNRLQTERS